MGIELAGPACQNVFIGAESTADGVFKALPFYEDKQADNQPAGGGDRWQKAVINQFNDGEITREITPACDIWRAGELEFKIYTPFLPIPDPVWVNYAHPYIGKRHTLKTTVIPAVFVELTLDNTAHPHPRKAFFGYEGNDPYSAMRRISIDNKINGVGQGRITGIFTDGTAVDCALAFSASELLVDDIAGRLPFGLGTTGLTIMTAGANEKRTWRFAVCFYRGGVVTSGKEASYLYTRLFKNIEDVARYGLENFELYKQAADDFDKVILQNQPADERRFLLSQSIKSYYGSTQLLVDEDKKEPLWIVNEGAYRMINTLDLAADHLFFEMRMNPWAVRSILEQYAEDYSYYDDVKDGSGGRFPGGISFTHDMGVMNAFSPRFKSAYELSGLTGCYSYMTQEQLVNWILCAGVYWNGTGDGHWLKNHKRIITRCLTSMLNRDGPDDAVRDGVMDMDSCMTGGGAEITTYDNVDKALGQARRSSYIAVKCWAAYLALEKMFTALGLKELAAIAAKQAEKCAATILKYKRDAGIIPAHLEEGNEAMTLSVVDGLIFPYTMGMFDDSEFINKYNDFVNALKKHFETALAGGCKFDSGAWKMSLTSDNSWPSKTFLCQSVSEKIFGLGVDRQADKAHASWLLDPENAFFAYSDQIIAGKALGSKYYPRGVTCILWV